jgi:glycosyltransferase involved in cell wall biosynthesis
MNEAGRIAKTIEAAKAVADEIVVVDSGSTDGTQRIVEALGCRVVFHAWEGYGPQKRYAEDSATFDWLLNLDADEVLTPEAIAEIRSIMMLQKPTCDGYRLRTVNVYPGFNRPRLFADFHNYIRLYNKTIMRFPSSLVHDAIIAPAGSTIGQLKGVCLHYSVVSLDQLALKLDRYTDLQAKEINKSKLYILIRIPFEYTFHFLKNYILRRHITGGLFGLTFAHIVARSKHERLIKLLR